MGTLSITHMSQTRRAVWVVAKYGAPTVSSLLPGVVGVHSSQNQKPLQIKIWFQLSITQ